MKNAVNSFYMHKGFACSISGTNYYKPSRKNKDKKYTKTGTGKRPQTSSKMTRCEWQAKCTYGINPEKAEIGWFFEVTVPHHNHQCALSHLAFSQHRQRDRTVRQIIETQ
ncbi:hypothetical protein EK21DRAFT_89718 [Setomelanomma holmii]|uniref:Uncharacterized protein n=1 Tax=Setomelanomma holmii TaxID=210430 RepID=A0A9P4LN17_9PLEO|nr:hypothetical protein EK21DRAFT_89718 [Setomelanomma holmii]